jgi:hypothetical protein
MKARRATLHQVVSRLRPVWVPLGTVRIHGRWNERTFLRVLAYTGCPVSNRSRAVKMQ